MEKNKQTVSILGCGWLGLPLGEKLKNKGYQVKGSTTREEKLSLLQDKGIRPYLISLSPDINTGYDPDFFETDMLILNIPPSRKQPNIDTFYPQQIKEVLKLSGAKSLRKILFVSSTSVYPNLNRRVLEEDAGGKLSSSGQSLLQVEQMLMEQRRFQVSILRFCGLYDEQRNPGRFLAGRTLKSNGNDCVNLIHRQDCVDIIVKLLEKDMWGEVFNACSDKHPSKASFYSQAASKLNLAPPEFTDDAPRADKIIDSSKLKTMLDFSFSYPDPAEAIKGF